MHIFETTDFATARRYRHNQFKGHSEQLPFNGGTINGYVKSVREDAAAKPKRWIVTIVEK